MKICIATIYTENIKNLASLTIEYNKRRYCNKHGYFLRIKTKDFSCKDIGFAKIDFILQLLKTKKYDWIYWCGADTMITNFNIELEQIIDNSFHFIIAKDVWDLNSDSFLIKTSKESLEFFEHIYSLYNDYIDFDGKPKDTGQRLPDGSIRAWAEQGAMIDILDQYKHIVKIVPQKVLNSYMYWLYPSPWHRRGLDVDGNNGTWEQGDFLVHWPGLPNEARIQLASNIIPYIVGDEE